MSQPLSEGALHLLAIDLPLACVLVAPLLLAASTLRGHKTPVLMVPAVILLVLGMSSIGAALLETQATDMALSSGSAAEIRAHQHELGWLAMSGFAAGTLLFALALLAWRTAVARLRRKSLIVASLSFGVVYALAATWLIFVAHRGAMLADHLAWHVRS